MIALAVFCESASRAVPVVSSLISDEQRAAFGEKNRQAQTAARAAYAGSAQKLISLEEARPVPDRKLAGGLF